MKTNSPPSATSRAALFAAAITCTALLAGPAAAQSDLHADDWSFNFFNDSSFTVMEFRVTEKSGRFSHNWLSAPMAPGIGLTMEFTDPLDTRCEILTRVVFHDGAVFDGTVNYCGTAIVTATDDWLYFE